LSSSSSSNHHHLHGWSWFAPRVSSLAQIVTLVDALLFASPIAWLGTLRWGDPKCGTWSTW
jgi:hypothetical protein